MRLFGKFRRIYGVFLDIEGVSEVGSKKICKIVFFLYVNYDEKIKWGGRKRK